MLVSSGSVSPDALSEFPTMDIVQETCPGGQSSSLSDLGMYMLFVGLNEKKGVRERKTSRGAGDESKGNGTSDLGLGVLVATNSLLN